MSDAEQARNLIRARHESMSKGELIELSIFWMNEWDSVDNENNRVWESYLNAEEEIRGLKLQLESKI